MDAAAGAASARGTTRAWVRERSPARPGTREADYAWMELWQGNGGYDWEAPAAERAAALARWQSWLRGSDTGLTRV